jgi:flagellin-like hook-associated protein FlgL
VGVNSLGDTLSNSGNTPSSASLGEFSGFANGGLGDTVKGTVSFTLNNGATHESFTVNSGETVTALMNQINSDNYQYGVTASLVATGGGHGFDSLILTSNTYGPTGEIGNTTHTQVTDTTGTSTLSYSAASAYNTGLSSGSIASNTAIYDSSSGQSNSLTGEAGIVSDSNGLSGVATISYSDGAGEALSATDLTNQADAETALNDLNLAIGDAAALDGYIGGQINMLDSVSSVITTQEENVVSAQNAVQATDYASATSNMSKYEILSQTGIAALAQANSVQQEVTKLLT